MTVSAHKLQAQTGSISDVPLFFSAILSKAELRPQSQYDAAEVTKPTSSIFQQKQRQPNKTRPPTWNTSTKSLLFETSSSACIAVCGSFWKRFWLRLSDFGSSTVQSRVDVANFWLWKPGGSRPTELENTATLILINWCNQKCPQRSAPLQWHAAPRSLAIDLPTPKMLHQIWTPDALRKNARSSISISDSNSREYSRKWKWNQFLGIQTLRQVSKSCGSNSLHSEFQTVGHVWASGACTSHPENWNYENEYIYVYPYLPKLARNPMTKTPRLQFYQCQYLT